MSIRIVDTKGDGKVILHIKDSTKIGHLEFETSIDYLRAFIKQAQKTIKDYDNSQENAFVINNFITLKLEHKTTVIYVNGERFEQCKYLLLNVSTKHAEDYDNIQSIDEAVERIGRETRTNTITPEEEFQGHCSNLQAWYEHDYDTRLLHRNIAFPLLRKLAESGDPIATKKFKDEIASRIEQGELNTYLFLRDSGYLRDFTLEELEIISSNIKDHFTKMYVQRDQQGIEPTELERSLQGIFFEENKIFVVSHFNNENSKRSILKYRNEQKINDKIKCRLIENRYLDFNVPTKKHRIVFQKELIDKTKKLLDNNNDITIAIPGGYGPLILKSKKANLKAYISPLILK